MSKKGPNSSSVCILGLGYIGLPLAGLVASEGLQVLGVDINPKVVSTLQNGSIHFVEPDLHTLVQTALASKLLRLTAQPEPADYFVICVPTPFKLNHEADLFYVEKAAESIVPVLKPGATVILESTVPPGSTRGVVGPILEKSGLRLGKELFLAYCPERVLPGQILKELVENDRVIGGIDSVSAQKARQFYAYFVRGMLHETDCDTAEMVKLVENAYRDVNIAFANELSLICDQIGLSTWKVIELANKHPRVKVLSPGPGVGGHCIAVDPWFIVEKAPTASRLIRAGREVNDGMPDAVVAKVEEAVQGWTAPKIACLGLSYKADVEDIRESPAILVVKKLLQKGYRVPCHDPLVAPQESLPLMSLGEALEGAHCAVLLVAHQVFKTIDWSAQAQIMKQPVFVDTRGILPPHLVKKAINVVAVS